MLDIGYSNHLNLGQRYRLTPHRRGVCPRCNTLSASNLRHLFGLPIHPCL